jgi:hypothetical protein
MKFINNACIDEGSILVDKALAKVIQNKHLMSKNLSCVTIIPNDYFLSKRVRANSKLVTKSWQLNIRQCDEYTFFFEETMGGHSVPPARATVQASLRRNTIYRVILYDTLTPKIAS